MTGILGQALAYAQRGWPVFPCRPGAKGPAIPSAHPESDPLRGECTGECGRQGHGFHDATTDPVMIRAWWQRWPSANVGIATGRPGPDVLDVDVTPSGSGYAAYNRLKAAGLLYGASALVRTRSGGLHAYYAGSAQTCGKLPRHFLDFKATGGYVVAPPSFVEADDRGPAGYYVLLGHRPEKGRINWQAVKRLLDPPRRFQQPRPRRTGQGENITGLVEWVARREAGDRNHPVFWAAKQAALAGALDSAAVERFVDAALRAGLRGGEREARRSIASGERAARGTQ